ncbi:uncharacterized protein [Venturia canescens]|uniref:uncharacterized protein n=1 Tax=Venturia canescens TaxID=32260 RepID=UPI001C9C5D57|nr:uncharacterized protein LOC122419355 [Venturia canescens]
MVEGGSTIVQGNLVKLSKAHGLRHQSISINHLIQPLGNSTASDPSLATGNNEKVDPQFTDYIIGVQFKDATEEWIRDDTYLYTARVVTEAIRFKVAVVMKLKGSNDEQVESIRCNLNDIAQNYRLEIETWMDEFIAVPHFGYLMSSIADYSRKSVIRAKILGLIKEKGYVTLEKCEEKNGGILIFVHQRDAADEIYFRIQWSVRFVTKYWSALHFFAIDSVQADEEFVAANETLLQTFCKKGVDKDELEELWNTLCLNIEHHKK